MTLAAIAVVGIAAAATVSAVGADKAADAAAEGAENAQATLQGGISRLTGFRQELKKANAEYKDWQSKVTGQLVTDVTKPALESQAYRDAQRRLLNTQAATGSVRSGAAAAGQAQLAGAESDAQVGRRLAVDQLLTAQTSRSDALRASTYRDEAALLGGQADAQQQEANAKAAGIEGVYGGISSGLSGIAGVAAGGAGGGGAAMGAPSGYGQTGGGGLQGAGVSTGAVGAGGIQGGQNYDAALLGGYSPEQIDAWQRQQRGY